jgi:hypothetical protein
LGTEIRRESFREALRVANKAITELFKPQSRTDFGGETEENNIG